jgi:phosphocarrier protein
MIKKALKKGEAKGTFTVRNDRGLHTRPCTEIVKCAAQYKSQVKLRHKKSEVNAKSLLGILMLAATKGTKIVVHAEGQDAEEAVNALLNLATEKNFNISY